MTTADAAGARATRRLMVSIDVRFVVACATAGYAALFATAALFHFYAFQSPHMDLGTMTQTVWSNLHGHFLEMTNDSGRNVMRFAYHVDPFLALLTPLFRLWPSGAMLLCVQAVAVATGAFPVFWLARKHLCSSRAGAHFAFAYLLFPATQFNAYTISSGFHSVAITVPALLYAIWFLDEGRLIRFGGFALLAISTKEEIGATVACLGIWTAVRHGRRRFGALVCVSGMAVTLFDFLVVIPHYAPNGSNPFEERYSQIGATPSGVVHTLVTHPAAFAHDVFTLHKLVYALLLLGPFLGFWLREPLLFLGAVPDLAINLLSSHADQTRIQYHWTAGIIPFVVAASVFGAAKSRRDPDRISFAVLAGAGCLALLSPITLGLADYPAVLAPDAHHRAQVAALRLIPAGAAVTATDELGAQLANRNYSATFPVVATARWAALDDVDVTYGDQSGYRRALHRFEHDPRWRTVFSSHGVVVLERRGG